MSGIAGIVVVGNDQDRERVPYASRKSPAACARTDPPDHAQRMHRCLTTTASMDLWSAYTVASEASTLMRSVRMYNDSFERYI